MYRILMVDDDHVVLEALRQALKAPDAYELEPFDCPRAALQRVQEADVDLVLTDFVMPSMDGIEFLKRFRDIQPKSVRILLSGCYDAEMLRRAVNQAHIYHFIDKPWAEAELRRVVAGALTYLDHILQRRRLAYLVAEQHRIIKMQAEQIITSRQSATLDETE